MPLRYLLDENPRGPIWSGPVGVNEQAEEPIELALVGNVPDLPLHTPDPIISRWIEREGYVLVSNDVNSIPRHLADHIAGGGHVPGLFLVNLSCPIAEIVEWLLVLAHDPDDYRYRDRPIYLPRTCSTPAAFPWTRPRRIVDADNRNAA